MTDKNSHCSYCGGGFDTAAPWPRKCAGCGNVSYLNPLPVAVVLLPVHGDDGGPDGLLVIRRTVPPVVGQLALPGGFIDVGETWQQAAVRELAEETGIRADAADVALFDVHSAPDGTVLVFGLLPPVVAASLPAVVTTDETSEWLVVDGPRELAFPLHTTVVGRYYAGR